MRRLEDFITLNWQKWVRFFLWKFWCSKSFFYKLLKRLKTGQGKLNPNKLAKIYNRLNLPRDDFFQDVLEEYYKDTGSSIRRLRIKKKLTLTELARASWLSTKTIIYLENNKPVQPHYTMDAVLEVLKWYWKKTS